MKCIRLTTNRLVKRLRWLMVGVILTDTVNTLLGQPKSYWQNPLTGHEFNRLMRLFVIQGGLPFVLCSLLYIAGAFGVASILPKRLALVTLFSFILGHYFGASTWWVYHWSYGLQASIIYGILLAIGFVLCGVGGDDPPRAIDPKDRDP